MKPTRAALIAPPRSATPRSCSGRASSTLPSRNTCASSRISRATGTSPTRSAISTSRAGQIDKAVEQFIRIADSLNDEGSCRRPARSTRRSSSSSPTTSTRCCRRREIAASQGTATPTRARISTPSPIGGAARGDARGARRRCIRLGSLDPGDYDADGALAAAARVEIGDKAGAAARPQGDRRASWPRRAGQPEAIEALRAGRAARARTTRRSASALLRRLLRRRRFRRARECATTSSSSRRLPRRSMPRPGRRSARRCCARRRAVDPSDTELRAQLARTFVARGDLATAGEYLTAETRRQRSRPAAHRRRTCACAAATPTRAWRSRAAARQRIPSRRDEIARARAGASPSRRPTPALRSSNSPRTPRSPAATGAGGGRRAAGIRRPACRITFPR